MKAWTSTNASSWWLSSPPSRWPSAAGERAHQPPPERGDVGRPRAWARWRCGRRSARARRRRTAARPGAARGGTRAKARSRSGRWCSTAWPKTRSKDASSNGSSSASQATVATSRPRRAALRLQRVEHPGGDVGAHGVADHAGLQHVQAEVAGAGADLQRALEAAHAAQRLGDLAEHLLAADLAVVDAPFGVVVGGRAVVVARVDGADLLRGGGGRGRHGAGVYARVHEGVAAGPSRSRACGRWPSGWCGRRCTPRASAIATATSSPSRIDPIAWVMLGRPRGRAARSSPPARSARNAGEANEILRPTLGLALGAAARRRGAHARSASSCCPPSTASASSATATIMREATERAVAALAARASRFALRAAHAGDHARGHHARRLRRRGRRGDGAPARAAEALLDWAAKPGRAGRWSRCCGSEHPVVRRLLRERYLGAVDRELYALIAERRDAPRPRRARRRPLACCCSRATRTASR